MHLMLLNAEADFIGGVGVILLLLAYVLLQLNRLSADTILYSGLNALGSLLILISLLFSWNLPSAIIETIWCTVSLLGMIRVIMIAHRSNTPIKIK